MSGLESSSLGPGAEGPVAVRALGGTVPSFVQLVDVHGVEIARFAVDG